MSSKILFADPVCHKRIAACFRQGIGKNIIAVDDQCRIRDTGDGCFQFVKGNIYFTEPVPADLWEIFVKSAQSGFN